MQMRPAEARRMRGLTQETVANALKISRSWYIQKEKHPERMTIAEAQAFARLVNVPLEDIIFLPDNSTLSRE